MKRNNVQTIIALTVIFVSLMVSPAASQDASQKIWHLKYWSLHNQNEFEGKLEARFIDSVKTATGGRVIITPYWNASLSTRPESFRALVNGVFDIGFLSTPDSPGQFPVSDVPSLPFLVKSPEEARDVVNTLHAKGLMPEYNTIKLCGLMATNAMYLVSVKKEVQKLEDLKGMKIRTPAGIPTETVVALGATPVAMPPSEVYMSANRGVIDGFITDPSRLAPLKLYEVAKVFVDNPIFVGIRFLGMNLNTWNSFPNDIKAIMEKEFAKMGREWLEENILIEKTAKVTAQQNGMKFITLAPGELARWKQATRSVETTFIKKLNDSKLPGQKVIDEAKASLGQK